MRTDDTSSRALNKELSNQHKKERHFVKRRSFYFVQPHCEEPMQPGCTSPCIVCYRPRGKILPAAEQLWDIETLRLRNTSQTAANLELLHDYLFTKLVCPSDFVLQKNDMQKVGTK